MTPQRIVRVAVNGYGAIGKRVADAISNRPLKQAA
jgi:glyceraldehyde-3-phosphate dehydrogenase/erythrose-4-phosphate dehydrogenase